MVPLRKNAKSNKVLHRHTITQHPFYDSIQQRLSDMFPLGEQDLSSLRSSKTEHASRQNDLDSSPRSVKLAGFTFKLVYSLIKR